MKGVKECFITKEKLPYVLKAEKGAFKTPADFYKFLEANQAQLKEHLLKYGGLLFRGFPLKEAQDFNGAIDAFGLGKTLDYIGGDSPRDKVKGKVYTSTEAPPSFKLPLHHEMSFIKNFPEHIYFFCHTQPEEGGQTIIADGRTIFQKMPTEIKKRFTEKKLQYVSHYWGRSKLMEMINKIQRGHKSWHQVFETESKEEVEKKCQENDFGVQWPRKEWVKIVQDRPAVISHPDTKEPIWFNQAHLYDFNPRLLGRFNYVGAKLLYARKNTKMHEIYYGDGSKIERDDLYKVMDVLDENTVYFDWRQGDFLVLDNVLAMHGRAPFKGKRRILTALTK